MLVMTRLYIVVQALFNKICNEGHCFSQLPNVNIVVGRFWLNCSDQTSRTVSTRKLKNETIAVTFKMRYHPLVIGHRKQEIEKIDC